MNLKKFSVLYKSLLCFFLLFSCSGEAVTSTNSNNFPTIQGKNLNKVIKSVPDDFVDKNLIVILAFQQWHQSLVDKSIETLENSSIKNELNIIEVPTLGQFTKIGQLYLDGTMRAAIKDDAIRDRTITVYLDKESLKETLNIPNEDTIYWYLIKQNTSDILLRGNGILLIEDIEKIKDLS